MDGKLEALEAAARGATPGPWFVDEDTRPGMEWNRSIDADEGHGHTVCVMTHSDGKFPERDRSTADFIAAADPTTILVLCEVARAAKEWHQAEQTDEHATLLADLNLHEALMALRSLERDGGRG